MPIVKRRVEPLALCRTPLSDKCPNDLESTSVNAISGLVLQVRSPRLAPSANSVQLTQHRPLATLRTYQTPPWRVCARLAVACSATGRQYDRLPTGHQSQRQPNLLHTLHSTAACCLLPLRLTCGMALRCAQILPCCLLSAVCLLQLSNLAAQANEIFGELMDEAKLLEQRSQNVVKRVEAVKDAVAKLGEPGA